MAVKIDNPIRFEKYISRGESCWEWTGAKTSGGYGSFRWRDRDGEWHKYGAHKLALELSGIEIPKGMVVTHKCDNPGCVNPQHLFLITPQERAKLIVQKGRNNTQRGEQSSNHKLTAREVTQIRIDYFSGKKTQKVLAEEYFVTQVCISNIVSYKTWKHLKKITSESLYQELQGVQS